MTVRFEPMPSGGGHQPRPLSPYYCTFVRWLTSMHQHLVGLNEMSLGDGVFIKAQKQLLLRVQPAFQVGVSSRTRSYRRGAHLAAPDLHRWSWYAIRWTTLQQTLTWAWTCLSSHRKPL